jgi:phage antirepressor YoqD-like protein
MDLFEAWKEVEREKLKKEMLIELEKEKNNFLSDPENIINAYQKQVEKLNAQLKQLEPKGEFYDMVTKTDKWFDMKEAAKIIGMPGWGRNNIFDLLRGRGVLQKSERKGAKKNEPYQEYVNRGYFKVVEKPFIRETGEHDISRHTVVSQKGIEFISKIIKDGDDE